MRNSDHSKEVWLYDITAQGLVLRQSVREVPGSGVATAARSGGAQDTDYPGLTADEAPVLAALCEVGEAEPAVLAQRAGIPEAAVAAILERLVHLAYATRQQGDTPVYRPVARIPGWPPPKPMSFLHDTARHSAQTTPRDLRAVQPMEPFLPVVYPVRRQEVVVPWAVALQGARGSSRGRAGQCVRGGERMQEPRQTVGECRCATIDPRRLAADVGRATFAQRVQAIDTARVTREQQGHGPNRVLFSVRNRVSWGHCGRGGERYLRHTRSPGRRVHGVAGAGPRSPTGLLSHPLLILSAGVRCAHRGTWVPRGTGSLITVGLEGTARLWTPERGAALAQMGRTPVLAPHLCPGCTKGSFPDVVAWARHPGRRSRPPGWSASSWLARSAKGRFAVIVPGSGRAHTS